MIKVGSNAPCPCGSGKKYKRCCESLDFNFVVSEKGDILKEVEMNDQVKEALKMQEEAFIKKFGRKPTSDDPVFFDPDADEPVRISADRIVKDMVTAMEKAGIYEGIIYAYKKTGMFVTESNEKKYSKSDMKEWNEAINEYERSVSC